MGTYLTSKLHRLLTLARLMMQDALAELGAGSADRFAGFVRVSGAMGVAGALSVVGGLHARRDGSWRQTCHTLLTPAYLRHCLPGVPPGALHHCRPVKSLRCPL